MTHEIELVQGYIDTNQVAHKRVVFGRRLTAKDLIQIDSDPQSQMPTQYALLLARSAMTAFGDLPMTDKKGNRVAVPLAFLLALDAIDYDDIIAGHDEFLRQTRGERVANVLNNSEVALAVGIEREGVTYDLVKFGKRLTAKDMVEADHFKLSGVARLIFELSKQIERITSSEHDLSLNVIDAGLLESLDIEDLQILRGGLMLWRESFRLRGNGVSGKRNGDSDLSVDERTASAGSGDSEVVN